MRAFTPFPLFLLCLAAMALNQLALGSEVARRYSPCPVALRERAVALAEEQDLPVAAAANRLHLAKRTVQRAHEEPRAADPWPGRGQGPAQQEGAAHQDRKFSPSMLAGCARGLVAAYTQHGEGVDPAHSAGHQLLRLLGLLRWQLAGCIVGPLGFSGGEVVLLSVGGAGRQPPGGRGTRLPAPHEPEAWRGRRGF